MKRMSQHAVRGLMKSKIMCLIVQARSSSSPAGDLGTLMMTHLRMKTVEN